MKRLVFILVLSVTSFYGCKMDSDYFLSVSESPDFAAVLDGYNEVPSIRTAGHGRLTLRAVENYGKLSYDLVVGETANITGAHLHLGKEVDNGPVIMTLFSGPQKTGQFDGTLAEGTTSKEMLTGPMAGKTVADLIKEVRRGSVYINVHTLANPAGEIRGQLK